MADKRKLSAEIERTLKKVTEGLETFEDFWQKLNQSTNANQKEKLEADMKKEIKKLQRLRDQLKLWLVSPDIKDKQVLMEARKNIEIQMEKFKAIERETKTKAYSKEGLVATGKVDPKEKEKEDILNWISNAIANLNQQYEKFESESEALTSRKKKLDKEDTSRLETLQSTMEQHKFHSDKLEAILRLVDNSAVQFEKIQSIRENVEYYVESNHEADFQANDMIYDELELDELNSTLKNDVGTAAFSASDCDNEGLLVSQPSTPSSLTSHHHKAKDDEGKKRQKNTEDLCAVTQNKSNPKTSQGNSYLSTSRPMQTPTKVNPVSTQNTQSISHKTTTVTNSGLGYAQVAGKLVANSPSKTSSNVVNGSVLSIGVNNFQPLALVPQSSVPTPVSSTLTPSLDSTQLSEMNTAISLLTSNTSELCPISAFSSCTSSAATHELSSYVNGCRGAFSGAENLMQNKWLGEAKKDNLFNGGTTMANGFIDPVSIQGKINQDLFLKALNSDMSTAPIQNSQIESNVMNGNPEDLLGTNHMNGKSQSPQPFGKPATSTTCSTQTVHLEPIYSVSPLGYAPLNEEQILSKMSLEASSNCLPLPCDSEKVRVYLPNNPCSTPSYYPVALPAVMQLPEFFNRLEPDTLFFVFYYMEGTKAQYQAAKALKQKSWRFHTKYMMWFQRHEEPKQITDEFEQGTYIFFDFEKWIQRKKEGFKFEYRYLEDHELI